MRRGHGKGATTIPVLMLLAAAPGAATTASGLTDGQFAGYLAWLQSVVDDRGTKAAPLHPLPGFDVEDPAAAAGGAGSPAQEGEGDALVACGRALIDLEQRHRDPDDWRYDEPRAALRTAREYRAAAEYDSALAWYRRTEARDAAGELRGTVAREALATAIALGDSTAVRRLGVDWLLADGAGTDDAAVIATLRWLIARGDLATLALVVDRAAVGPGSDPSLAYWLAYAHAAGGAWSPCLASLRELLDRGAPPRGLDAAQRSWVLTAVPDMLFLTGDAAGAAPLYRALGASDLPGVAAWSRLQAANLDLLGGDPARAAAAYAELCRDDAAAAWRDFACRMASFAPGFEDDLGSIGGEGEPHGDAHDEP